LGEYRYHNGGLAPGERRRPPRGNQEEYENYFEESTTPPESEIQKGLVKAQVD